jgi:hypothetical protein
LYGHKLGLEGRKVAVVGGGRIAELSQKNMVQTTTPEVSRGDRLAGHGPKNAWPIGERSGVRLEAFFSVGSAMLELG